MTAQLRERTRTDPVWCAFCRTEPASHVIEGPGHTVALGPACLDRLRADITGYDVPRLFAPRRFAWEHGAPVEQRR